MMIMTLW